MKGLNLKFVKLQVSNEKLLKVSLSHSVLTITSLLLIGVGGTSAHAAGRLDVVSDGHTDGTFSASESTAEVRAEQSSVTILKRGKNIQNQPITVVQGTPVSENSTDRLRQQRLAIEAKTEQRIAEKLEEARIADERARAEKLFGNGELSSQSTSAVTQANTNNSGANSSAVAPAPAVMPPSQVTSASVQAPAPVVVVAPVAAATSADHDEEIALDDAKSKNKDLDKEFKSEIPVANNLYYIGGQVGFSDYPSADNVKGNIAMGISVGAVVDEHFVVEGSFLFSDYQVQEVFDSSIPFKEMSQYTFMGALKYLFSTGKLRPSVGALVGYTYRRYSLEPSSVYSAYSYPDYSGLSYNGGEGSSNSFDIGLTAGIDLSLTPNFSIGVESRYLTNVSNRRSWPQIYSSSSFFKPMEEIDNYSVLLTGKFWF